MKNNDAPLDLEQRIIARLKSRKMSQDLNLNLNSMNQFKLHHFRS